MKGDPSILNNLIIYEIYVRNHGPNGTFNDVTRDLKRIKSLGVDVIWLMPIHPIGEKHKKGTLGCPYSIRDYQKINPEYGTIYDFQNLIGKAHQIGLKVMIDVVYNHTSHDSTLVMDHPEFFHQDQDGRPVTTVPAWSDVIDLKYPNHELQKYLIETLCFWVNMGVDGFRCDVASIVPLSFWLDAKDQVEALNPDVIWLAESVHTAWVIDRRREGLIAQSDTELYQAFDLTYDYDIWPIWQAALQGKVPVLRYLEMVEFQNGIYPTGFIKMRCVENHDNPRIMALASDEVAAKAWTAFEVFNKGAFLLYAGQESGTSHTPSLFDIDKIDWKNYRLQNWFRQLFKIKKSDVFVQGTQHFLSASPAIQTFWQHPDKNLIGIFNVSNCPNQIQCQLPDGDYKDLISNKNIRIINQKLMMKDESVYIFEINHRFTPKIMEFEMLKFCIQ
jgi:glycosidase